MNNLSFIGKKARKVGEVRRTKDGLVLDEPYATIIGVYGWKYEVLKKYANDDAKQYARWFVRVHGDFTEMGDTYVSDVVGRFSTLQAVDGRPPTVSEQTEYNALAVALRGARG